MSPHELPDDLASWPDDPFEVIGVERTVEKRDAHRAYIRLIKKYKPDHSPAQFQRIHEAYEQVKTTIAMREQFGDWVDEADEDEDDFDLDLDGDDLDVTAADEEMDVADPTDLNVIEVNPLDPSISFGDLFAEDPMGDLNDPSFEELSEEIFADSTPEEVVEFVQETLSQFGLDLPTDAGDLDTYTDDSAQTVWQTAVEGDYARAYQELMALCDEGECGSEVWLRLYWLLKVVPELDTSCEPVDWLVLGIEQSEFSPQIVSIYARELRQNPAEAVHERCTRLVSRGGSLMSKSELLSSRWDATSKLSQLKLIVNDLEIVRNDRELEDDECWARLLLSAIDHLAWEPNLRHVLIVLLQELEEMVHLHQLLDDELHRSDVLIQVAEEMQIAGFSGATGGRWAKLIRYSWLFPISDLLDEAEAMLGPLALDPDEMLSTVDTLIQRIPHAMSHLCDFAERVQFMTADDFQDDDRSDEVISNLLQPFFRRYHDYHRSRRAMLKFCVAESLDPHALVTAADEGRLFVESWLDHYESDTGLRLVWAAYRAFQA